MTENEGNMKQNDYPIPGHTIDGEASQAGLQSIIDRAKEILARGDPEQQARTLVALADSVEGELEALQRRYDEAADRAWKLENQLSDARRKIHNLRNSRADLAEVLRDVCLDAAGLLEYEA